MLRIFIWTPAVTTGGPEALHQLAESCTRQGFDCALYYQDRRLSVPDYFAAYGDLRVVDRIPDADDSVVVIPEGATNLVPAFRRARVVLWWLSVDNNNGLFTDFANPALVHAYQSEYARLYLQDHGVAHAYPLFDYIHVAYHRQDAAAPERLNLIAFNARKGLEATRPLIERLCHVHGFLPLAGLTREQVHRVLRLSKLYLDFGNHPGKDRGPREAALLGNCVLVGTRGAACNAVDVPIPARYKVEIQRDPVRGPVRFRDLDRVCDLVRALLQDYPSHVQQFAPYVDQIRREKEVFDRQVHALFSQLGGQGRGSRRSHLDQALAHHQAGRLAAAERAYRDVLAADPEQPDALHGLGVLAFQAGRPADATAWMARALAHRPDSGAFHSNLGLALSALGRLDEAIAALRRSVELLPGAAEAHFNLGNAYKEQKRLDEAEACYRQALALNPAHVAAHNNLGNALRDRGAVEAAAACFRQALAVDPNYVEAHLNLSNSLRDLGRAEEAEACCRKALALDPGRAAAWNNLGNALRDLGRKEEAAACYRRTLELAPNLAEAHSNLGAVLLSLGKLTEAVACYRRAVACRPDHAEGYSSLANALLIQGQLEEGDACYRRALELQPADAAAHSGFLLWQQYRPGVTLASLAAAHADWEQRHGQPFTARPHTFHEPLRLGFVSPDFGRHPVGFFSIRVLEALAARGFDLVCYSACLRRDDLASRFRSAARLWREVRTLPDEALAEQIRADGIDVLFDLAGHTAGNRLPVFARKPAPVQITWIGSEGTTGLAAIDYLLADAHLIPAGAERFYRERVLRLPEVYVCYDPPADAPAVASLSARQRGHVTLGSFNNPAKMHPGVVATWAKILHRLPGARLVLKYRCLTDATLRRRFTDWFAGHGIGAERLELRDWSPHAEMLAEYADIDLALDPFPFAGGVTTCEALWMGVPVLTCPGETFAGRHSLSYLSAVGLTEAVAPDLAGYVDLAAAWAGDLDRLALVRGTLRERMSASALCDGKRLATHLAALLQQVVGRSEAEGDTCGGTSLH